MAGSRSTSGGKARVLGVAEIFREGEFSARPKFRGLILWLAMDPTTKPTPPENTVASDDDLDEPLGERQPEANDVIICAGGCE
jgi:hypothetical protein